MDRISINLLPPALKENKQLTRRKRLINLASIGLLGFLIFVTTCLIITSVIENTKLNQENTTLTALNNNLNSLKEKEVALIILKKRINSISQIIDKQYPPTASFSLITSLLSSGIEMQSFDVDQTSKVTLHGTSVDAASLQQFFDNLTDPKINDGKVTKTVIANLSRGASPQLIFDLEITTNAGK